MPQIIDIELVIYIYIICIYRFTFAAVDCGNRVMVIMIPSLDAVLDSIYRCAEKKASHTQDVTHGQYLYIYTLYIVYCIYIILDTWLSKCQKHKMSCWNIWRSEHVGNQCGCGSFLVTSSQIGGGSENWGSPKPQVSIAKWSNLGWFGVPPIFGHLLLGLNHRNLLMRPVFPQWWLHFARFFWKASTTSHVLGYARHGAWCQHVPTTLSFITLTFLHFLPSIQAFFWIGLTMLN